MMTALIAVLAGAAAGACGVWLLLRGSRGAWEERIRGREAEVARLSAEIISLRAERDAYSEKAVRLEAGLSAEQAAHERLVNEFKALSADALRINRADFLEQARLTFAQLQQQASGDLEQRKLAVESLVRPLGETLAKFELKVSDMEKSRAAEQGALGAQIVALSRAQSQWHEEAARLSTALRSTTGAGSWGELQLRRVVEMADMLPYCDFAEQVVSGRLRADMVIRLPGGQQIVVDAKAPLEDYRAAVEAADEATRAERLAAHAKKVRGHVADLGSKGYSDQFQPSPEFVVLFMPGDQFLNAALQSDPRLMDWALSNRVLLATPTTLIALLKATSFGWSKETISKNAEEVRGIGRELYDRIKTFADNLERVGSGLKTALDGYNAAVGSFEQKLLPGARRFDELGAKGSKGLEAPSGVEGGVRDITKRA